MFSSHLGANLSLLNLVIALSCLISGIFEETSFSYVDCSSYIFVCYLNSIYDEEYHGGEESTYRCLKLEISSLFLLQTPKLSEAYN